MSNTEKHWLVTFNGMMNWLYIVEPTATEAEETALIEFGFSRSEVTGLEAREIAAPVFLVEPMPTEIAK